jgi:putative nucleotidyltransferase with HDIG domain
MIRELSGHEIDALHYELLVKDIVAAAEKLPPFPDIAWKIISLVKATAPIKEIEELISYDQVITAKILQLGNSVYFGRRYDIRSLKEAMILLGDDRLIQVVIASCATIYYVCGSSRDERELWEHSVTTALISEIVARGIHYNGILTLYTAALLHDIGNTILNHYAKIYLQSSLRELRGRSDAVRAERRALGIDHQELGGIIARNWKFPPEIAAAIEHHHNPEKAGLYEEITSLVHLADLLAISFAKKNDKQPNKGIDLESEPVFKKFSITPKMIDEFQAELETGMAGVMRALGSV